MVTEDKSTPPVPMVTEQVPEFPTITSPAKLVRVLRSKVMASVLPLIILIPGMPAEGYTSRVPEVAAVIVSVLTTELKDVCTSESRVPEEERKRPT